MKISITAALCFVVFVVHAQVAINTNNSAPHNSAMLDITSNTKGILIPRMTSAVRIGIVSPANGLMVMDTTTNSLWYYNGTSWGELSSVNNNLWNTSSNNVFNTNSGRVGIGTSTPLARLHVADSSVIFSGLAGRTMMWHPEMGALRIGPALYDDDFIGHLSFASGLRTRASGARSTAMGEGTVAKSMGSVAMGRYNDSIISFDEQLFFPFPTSPLFMLGNGSSNSARSNAMVVYHNGNVDMFGSATAYDSYFGSTTGAHGVSVGRSGDNYGSVGYGLTFNATSDVYKYRVSDFSSMLRFNAGGFDFNTAPVGITGNNISYTTSVKILQNGNMGIGTTAPTSKLHVIGNICATGSIGACSDVRYKTNLAPLSNALAAILQLHPVYYNWKKEFIQQGFTDQRHIGFSAQEIETYFPEIVQTGTDGYKSVDYSRLTPVLVQAIKEQQEQIDELKKENSELRKMKETIEKLKRDMELLKEK